MNTPDSLRALRAANPRLEEGFADSVDVVADVVRARVASTREPHPGRAPRRRRLARAAAAGGALAVAAAVAALLTLGSPRRGPVGDAAAAVEKAATLTSGSAERSGTAVVRITHDGKLWAGTTIQWNGADLALSQDAPLRRGRPGGQLLVVDGTMYGIENGGWAVLGPPESIDPGSGTTPAEYLATVRQDVGGTTLRRIAGGVGGLTTRPLADGSTVYSGTVAAGLIARESGFKEGQAIRVLPFGYVAHGEASDPAALLDVAVTVNADGIVREIAVRWPGWTYTVAYNKLGSTSAPVAPANAKPLRRMLR
ncbi:MAG TPA: hypothetical protein VFL41_03730 [Gaiellaceae bacterium]|nr:hypothetical protein [Gaiellaceae bacterium]